MSSHAGTNCAGGSGSGISSHRNLVVDHNSVQSQFATLERERSVLGEATRSAECERRKEHSLLTNLRTEQARLSDKIRVAHDRLGTINKKRQMLQAEKSRLQKAMNDDRRILVELDEVLKGMSAEEISRKRRFVSEMDSFNEELDCEIRRYEDTHIASRYVTVSSIEEALEKKIKSEMDTERSEGKTEGRWTKLYETLRKKIASLREATARIEEETRKTNSLNQEHQRLRSNALHVGRCVGDGEREPIGEMELDELERMWDQQDESNADVGSDSGVRIAIPSRDGYIGSQATRFPGQDQHESQVNMGLFYGAVDHQGDVAAISAHPAEPDEYGICTIAKKTTELDCAQLRMAMTSKTVAESRTIDGTAAHSEFEQDCVHQKQQETVTVGA